MNKKKKKSAVKKIRKHIRKKEIAVKKINSEKTKIPERIKTGVQGFDKLVEGGFEYKSINLVVGGIGSGKTIFAMQFLMEGLKNNENVLYITFEESKQEFYKNMLDFGWDLEKFEKSGKFVFLEYSPEKIKMMLDEGGGAVESIILKQKINRMVIDSISSFSLLFEDEPSRRQAVLSLFDIIRKWNCTTLLTLQEDTSKEKMKKSSLIEFQADSLILFYLLKVNGKRNRFLEILKMRGTKHSSETHSFEISKNGIKVGKVVKAGV